MQVNIDSLWRSEQQYFEVDQFTTAFRGGLVLINLGSILVASVNGSRELNDKPWNALQRYCNDIEVAQSIKRLCC